MPISKKDAPDVLPDGAKNIYVSAFNGAYNGTCKDRDDRDECGAKIAWSAVKNKFKKEGDKWVKKSDSVRELSLYISKASFDKKSQQMRCLAVASDTDDDLYGDSMSADLFADFISRIETKELVPEKFRSDYWESGMPYLSISHYSDQEGKGVPGKIESIYVDGNRLKIKFILEDTEIGRAIFKSIMDDLYGDNPEYEEPVRISIAFLDYEHEHKNGGYIFVRNSFSKPCPECLKGNEHVIYLKGHLIHCAFTRVPVNPRTEIVDLEERSMKEIKTKRDDAASIVGDDVAEELEQNETIIGKSEVLVVKSEEVSEDEAEAVVEAEVVVKEEEVIEDEESEEIVEEEEVEEKSTATSIADMLGEREAAQEMNRITDLFYMFSDVVYNIFRSEEVEDKQSKISSATEEFKNMLKAKSMLIEEDQGSVLAKAWKEFSDAYGELPEGVSKDEKLRSIQSAFESLGEAVVESFEEDVVAENAELPEGSLDVKSLAKAMEIALQPMLNKLSLLETAISSNQKSASVIPTRRSISPSLVPQAVVTDIAPKETKKLSQISQLVNKSVGLPDGYVRPGVVIKEEEK